MLAGEPVPCWRRAGAPRPGACGVVPVGTEHAWRGGAQAAAGSTCAHRVRAIPASSRPTRSSSAVRAPSEPAEAEPHPLDVRDPRNRNLFLLGEADMDVDRLRGAPVAAPAVSASMATAALPTAASP